MTELTLAFAIVAIIMVVIAAVALESNRRLRKQVDAQRQISIGPAPHQMIRINPAILGELLEKYPAEFITREDAK